jgi:hypothetical protein
MSECQRKEFADGWLHEPRPPSNVRDERDLKDSVSDLAADVVALMEHLNNCSDLE